MRALPNLITALRLLLVPAVVFALARGQYALGAVLFALAGVSDGLDGWLARRFGWTSAVGALLDAVADKLMIVATIVALVMVGVLPLWVTLVLLSRDMLVVLGFSLHHRLLGGMETALLPIGKLHVAVVFGVLTLTLIEAAGAHALAPVLPWLFALAAASAVSSFLAYLRQGLRRLRAVRGRA